MTNQQHPITPPPELVQQWHDEAMKGFRNNGIYECDIATQAARWGSDQELEACCEWIDQNTGRWDLLAELRTARRPKPLSLKQQALATLEEEPDDCKELLVFDTAQVNIIRRALEQLNDD
jgi:hypothetical protein